MAQSRWRGPATGGATTGVAPAAPAPADPLLAKFEAEAARTGQKVFQNPDGSYRLGSLAADQTDTSSMVTLNQVAPLPAQPVLPTDPMAGRPVTPLTPQQAVGQFGASVPAFEGAITGSTFGARPQMRGPTARAPTGGFDLGGAAPGQSPAAEQAPAEVDRARIDALLGNVSKATSGLMGLGERDLAFSAAQAQLRQGLEQGQRQSLALARSGSRRDRAANEARAIQGNTELAAQTGQAAAGLRATEEAAQQQIRLDAYKAAGDLGLNAGALDLNAQNLDMNAATNFLNQMFARENLQLQLDQQEAERVTNFVRDMALLSRDYYSLSVQERDAVRQDLTRRYGISETSRVALEQLEAQGKVNWEQVGANMLAGAVIGAAQVGAKAALGG